jgi:hypothetical protein
MLSHRHRRLIKCVKDHVCPWFKENHPNYFSEDDPGLFKPHHLYRVSDHPVKTKKAYRLDFTKEISFHEVGLLRGAFAIVRERYKDEIHVSVGTKCVTFFIPKKT